MKTYPAAITGAFHFVFPVGIKDHQDTLPLALLLPPLGELICLCSQTQIGETKVTYCKRPSFLSDSVRGQKFQYSSQSLPAVCLSALLETVCGCGYMHRLEIQTPQMMDLSGGMSSFENAPLKLSVSSY